MLTLKSSGKSTCLWCAEEKEGVEMEMHDGSFKGFLCWTDFRQIVKARSQNGKPKQSRPQNSPAEK